MCCAVSKRCHVRVIIVDVIVLSRPTVVVDVVVVVTVNVFFAGEHALVLVMFAVTAAWVWWHPS